MTTEDNVAGEVLTVILADLSVTPATASRPKLPAASV